MQWEHHEKKLHITGELMFYLGFLASLATVAARIEPDWIMPASMWFIAGLLLLGIGGAFTYFVEPREARHLVRIGSFAAFIGLLAVLL